MATKRRRRLKWFVGGGVLLALLFVLGDSSGWFVEAPDGPKSDGGGEGVAGDDRSVPFPANRGRAGSPAPRPDAEAASVPTPSSVVADVTGTAIGAVVGQATPARLVAARVDEVMGIIARYESAISADDLAGLAVLVDRVRRRPILAPPSLARRWDAVQARARSALTFGDRLRRMVEQGEILQAERLLAPILAASTPVWMRTRLDAATTKFGWPVLSRNWQVVGPAGETGSVLAKMRRVRFVKDGDVHEGVLWRVGRQRATVRVAGAGGFMFPVVACSDLEPVAPRPGEALAQGIAAARTRRARRVALWSCHFHERGDTARAARLRALIR